MSCWRKITADVLKDVDKYNLKRALNELGYGLDDKLHNVDSYESVDEEESRVDAVITANDKPLSLGIRYNIDKKGHMGIVGDFWNTGIDHETFVDDIAQQYTRFTLEERLQKMGYSIKSVKMNEKQQLEMIAYCA